MTVSRIDDEMRWLTTSLNEQFTQAAQSDRAMSANLKELGYEA